ncbi:MAG TPA: PAS domain S-box protein [Gemmatimonadaceae bacterium]|nr:PAS domain S-box protein [Gemmatimonadaceae bacterium]
MQPRHAAAPAAAAEGARLERRRAPGSAAEQALALYRAIFVKSTEAIAIIDADGSYLEQNAAHAELLGYSDDELRDQTPAIHLGDEQFAAIAADLAATGVSRRECRSRAKNGRERIIELSSFAVNDASGEPLCYVGIKRDVTEQRHAAAELRQKFDELQAVHRMTDAVTHAAALEEIYGVALDELQHTVHAHRASILLYDDDGIMRFKAWRGLSDEYRRAVEGHSPWSRDDPDPQPVLVPDVEADPHLTSLLPVLAAEGIRAVGFIPLVADGQLHGKFMIYFDAPHVVPPAQLRLAQSIAGHIAFAIARRRSDTALRESEERYRRLVQHSPAAVLVHSGGNIVFVNSAALYLLGATDPAEVLGRRYLDFVHPAYHGIVVERVRTIASGRAVPRIEEKFVKLDGTPIDVEVATIEFNFQGKPAVQVVASDITERRRREQEQKLLAEAGDLLSSSLDYQETLRSITRLAVPAIADWCLVDLTDEQGGFTRIAASSADPADAELSRRLLRHYAPRSDATVDVSAAARNARAELVTEVDDSILTAVARDAEHLEMARAMGLRSYVSVPLVARGRTLGVVTLGLGKSARHFTPADLPLAEELARRSALAVDNARLFREAHEANRAKTQFLTTMSHELRTPLNAIGGYAELIEMGLRGPVTPEQLEDLGRIQRSQRHLLGLINDLLNFARIERGHVELKVEEVSVEEELAAVQPLIEPLVTAKEIRYSQHRGDASIRCRADRDRMRQVLLNLLSNAVKFTASGGEIALGWETRDGVVDIHVRDTGTGIPTHKLNIIFEPFVQLTNSLTRVTEGTGLGLAISRELARAMNGDVTVVSAVGKGSTFTFTLPRA